MAYHHCISMHHRMYNAIRYEFKEDGFFPVCVSRKFGEWRVLYMDDGTCPFTLDLFYVVELGLIGSDLRVRALHGGFSALTEFELAHIPPERIAQQEEIDKMLDKESEELEKKQEVA